MKHMFPKRMGTGAFFIIVPGWKHPRCASTGKWINNCGAFRRGMKHQHIQQHWINLKNVLSKSSQTLEDILFDSIYRNSRKGKTNVRREKQTVTVLVSGVGEWLGGTQRHCLGTWTCSESCQDCALHVCTHSASCTADVCVRFRACTVASQKPHRATEERADVRAMYEWQGAWGSVLLTWCAFEFLP